MILIFKIRFDVQNQNHSQLWLPREDSRAKSIGAIILFYWFKAVLPYPIIKDDLKRPKYKGPFSIDYSERGSHAHGNNKGEARGRNSQE